MSDKKRESPSYDRISTYQATYSSPSFLSTGRDDIEDKQRLEKQNFDLKMKIYHLEETIKRYQDAEHRSELSTTAARSEVGDLKLKLEEMQIEIEQRELLMVKASSIITTLKGELDRCKDSLDQQNELETKVRHLKHSNDDLALQFKNQILELEAELNSMKQTVMMRESEKSSLEDKIKQMELTIAHLQDRVVGAVEERGRSEGVRQNVEEELTQTRAHVDLFKIRLEEEMEEKEKLKNQINELHNLQQSLEERHKSRILETTSHYETQTRLLKTTHEHDLERLRNSQLTVVAEIRESYQAELARVTTTHDGFIFSLKQDHSSYIAHLHDTHKAQITEKNEEIHHLRMSLEQEKNRFHELQVQHAEKRNEHRELSVRYEILQRDFENFKNEYQTLHAQNSSLKDETTELKQKFSHLGEKSSREYEQKIDLSQQIERLTQDNIDLQHRLKEAESELSLTTAEMKRLSYADTQVITQTQNLENVSKDYERYKILYQRLTTDNLTLTHENVTLKKELDFQQLHIANLTSENEGLKSDLRSVKLQVETTKSQVTESQHILSIEREQRIISETACSELRNILTPLQKEVEFVRQQLQERRLSYEQKLEFVSSQGELWKNVSLKLQGVMVELDEQLSIVLDASNDREVSLQSLSYHQTYSSQQRQSRLSPSHNKSSSRQQQQFQENDNNDQQQQDDRQLLDDTRHLTTTLIERLGNKKNRLSQLRQHFTHRITSLTTQHELHVSKLHETAVHLTHRVEKVHTDMLLLKSLLNKEKEMFTSEKQQFSQIGEKLISEHREKEQVLQQTINALISEKNESAFTIDNMKRLETRLTEELSQLKSQVNSYKEEMKRLDSTEQLLQTLTTKFESVAHHNFSLEQEKHTQSAQITQLTQNLESLSHEKSRLLVEVEKLTTMVQSKEELIAEHDDRLQMALREVDRLRLRQIDPDLALALMETQQQLTHSTSHTGSSTNNGNEKSVVVIEQSTLMSLQSQLNRLIDRCDILLQHQRSSHHGNSNNNQQLEREIQEILQQTDRLLTHVKKLYAAVLDVITSSASGGIMSTNGNALLLPLPQQSLTAGRGEFYFPSRRAVTSTPGSNNGNHNNPYQAITLDDLRDSPPAATAMRRLPQQQTLSAYHLHQPPQQQQQQQQQQAFTRSVAVVSDAGGSSGGYGQRYQSQAPAATGVARSMDPADQEVIDRIRRRINQQPSQSGNNSSNNKPPTRRSTGSEREAVHSPDSLDGSAMGASMSQSKRRLGKLDRNLQLLAKKLDAFDFASK